MKFDYIVPILKAEKKNNIIFDLMGALLHFLIVYPDE